MSLPTGLICLLIKSANFKPKPFPGSMVGGAVGEGLLGAGLGAGMGGLYGYFTAPDEIDPETGQTKSKWNNVWPHMGLGALAGGTIGAVTGAHAGFGEKGRHADWMRQNDPEHFQEWMRGVEPENIPQELYGDKGLHAKELT